MPTIELLQPPQIIGKSPRSQELKPTELWRRTGVVKPGSSGAGCAVECIYCNQIAMDAVDGERQAPYLSGMVDGGLSINTRMYVGSQLDKTISLEELAKALKHWPLYTPQSPIILENFNDPGNDWKATAGLAEMLVEQFGHQAAISFITKMGIKPSDIEALQTAQKAGAKLIGIVTYTNMPQIIEPSSSKVRLNTIRRLKEAGIPVIVSMRPMIKGINDSQKNIDRVLLEVAPYADFIIVGGLFVFEQFTIDAFREAGYPLDEFYSQQIYSPAKVMKSRYKEIVRTRAEELAIPVLVHNHTSCAIAHVMTTHYGIPTSDRFTHWVSPVGLQFEEDCAHCPPEQKQHCQEDSNQLLDDVIQKAQQVLIRLGYPDLTITPSLDVPNTLLLEGAVLTFEEIATIKEGCGWYVDNLPNAAGMYLRLSEALVEDMKLNPKTLVAGMLLIGQEWHVIIRAKDMSDEEVVLVEKWIRSRSRHRARVLRLEDILQSELETTIQVVIDKSHGLQSPEEITRQITQLFTCK